MFSMKWLRDKIRKYFVWEFSCFAQSDCVTKLPTVTMCKVCVLMIALLLLLTSLHSQPIASCRIEGRNKILCVMTPTFKTQPTSATFIETDQGKRKEWETNWEKEEHLIEYEHTTLLIHELVCWFTPVWKPFDLVPLKIATQNSNLKRQILLWLVLELV